MVIKMQPWKGFLSKWILLNQHCETNEELYFELSLFRIIISRLSLNVFHKEHVQIHVDCCYNMKDSRIRQSKPTASEKWKLKVLKVTSVKNPFFAII